MSTDMQPMTQQPIKSAPLQVTGALKQALDLMVWKGLTRDEAAKEAGLQPHSLYVALRKSHVKSYYLSQLGALRESTRAKNFHRLDAIAESSRNDMARVAAIKTMEQFSDEPQLRANANASAGFVIIVAPDAAHLVRQPIAGEPRLINVTPADNPQSPPDPPPVWPRRIPEYEAPPKQPPTDPTVFKPYGR